MRWPFFAAPAFLFVLSCNEPTTTTRIAVLPGQHREGEPPTKTAPPLRSVAPDAIPRVPEWTRHTESIEIDGIRVRIIGTEIAHVQWLDLFKDLKKSAEPRFLVHVEILSASETKKTSYRTWRSGSDFFSLDVDWATLKDEFDNPYQRISFGRGSHIFGDAVSSESLYPNKPIRDVLVFEVPVAKAKTLHLDLPGKNVGLKGNFRFEIPIAAREVTAKAKDPDPKVPTPKVVAESEPKAVAKTPALPLGGTLVFNLKTPIERRGEEPWLEIDGRRVVDWQTGGSSVIVTVDIGSRNVAVKAVEGKAIRIILDTKIEVVGNKRLTIDIDNDN